MEILKGIETINGYPALYFKELDLIAISDLQLGEEMYLAEEKGIFVPQVQLKEEKRVLKEITRKVKAKRILINGDFKHEFGEASKQEWREVIDFLEFLKKKFEEIIIVRGNHDNYLLNIVKKFDLDVYDPYYLEKGYLFTHGHKKVEVPKEVHTIVIGHEEPAVLIRSGFDKAKYKAILFGKMKNGKNIICLPAFSYLSSGTEMNLVDEDEILSPILKEEVNLHELKVVAIDEEIGEVYLGCLKNISKQII